MHHPKLTRFITARDATRIAWHTHLDENAPADATDEPLRDRPTLLLSNGLGTSENFWRHVVHVFARDHRVVHWSYRGHGASERATGSDYSIRTQADDLARVTEAAIARGDGRTAPVHIGFSMGVCVLLELYRVRPDLVRAMVLVGGPADAPYSNTLPMRVPGALAGVRAALRVAAPFVPAFAPAMRAVYRSPHAYTAARALGLIHPRAPRDDIAEFTRNLTAMDARVFWQTLIAVMSAHASDVLPTVTVPVLVVGAAHDLLIPPSQLRQLHASLAQSQSVMIEDSGHAVLVEAGPEVCAAIRVFLRPLTH